MGVSEGTSTFLLQFVTLCIKMIWSRICDIKRVFRMEPDIYGVRLVKLGLIGKLGFSFRKTQYAYLV